MELPRDEKWATLVEGRYSVRVSPALAYEVSVPDQTRAFEGRFLNTPPPGGSIGSIVFATPAPADDTWLPRHPCRDHTPTPVGPSLADFAEALTRQPGLDVSEPRPIRMDGQDGLRVDIELAEGLVASKCEDATVSLFSAGSDDWEWDQNLQARWYILDVDGERVVVHDQCIHCTAPHARAAQRMVESITFHSRA
jgi:hypothetical protein